MRAGLLLAVLLLAGCASVWDRPGATDADFARDNYACWYGSQALPAVGYTPSVYPQSMTGTGQAWAGVANQSGALSAQLLTSALRVRSYEMCMAAAGWVRQ